MGKLLKKFDPNYFDDAACSIHLTNGLTVFLDLIDFERLYRFRWFAKKSGSLLYACREFQKDGKTFTIRMHREITNCPKGYDVHHIDGNTLNNRRSNLTILKPVEHHHLHQTGELFGDLS